MSTPKEKPNESPLEKEDSEYSIKNNCDENNKMYKVENREEKSNENSEEECNGISPLDDIDFTKKSCWTDLTLQIEDAKLYVPKSHLALASPVFRLMFVSDFKEKDLNVISLPGKKYEDFKNFLMCTHPGALLKVTYHIVPNVLPLAHEYQVKWLLDDCVNSMMTELDASRFIPNTKSSIFSKQKFNFYAHCSNICQLAEKYDLKCVIERFIERFSTINYKCYKDLSEFQKISIEVRCRIFCMRLDYKEDPTYY